MAISVGEIEALLRLRDELTPSLKLASTQLAKTGQDVKAFGTQVQAAGSAMLPFSAAVAGAGLAVIKLGKDFETSMTRIETLSGESAASVSVMRKAVLDLAPTVGIGPVALSEALRVVTSTGIHGAEALEILRVSAMSSAVGMGDTKDVARALTAVIAAYGKENISASTAAEVLFKTVREGGAEADEVASALGRVVGITAQVGVSFQQVGTFIATFTRLGVNAEEAVTALRGVMTTILKPSKEAKDQLAALGTSVDELRASIKERGLSAALIELVQRTNGSADAMSAIVPNVRALAGILGTAGSQAEAMTEIQRRLATASDDLGAAFGRTGETLDQKFNTQLAKMQTIAVKAFGVFRDTFQTAAVALDPLVNAVGHAVDILGSFPPAIKLAALGFVVLLAAAAPVLIALGSLIRLVGFSLEGFGQLTVVLATVSRAFGLTAASATAANVAMAGSGAATAAAGMRATATAAADAGAAVKIAAAEQLSFNVMAASGAQLLLPLSGALSQTAATAEKAGAALGVAGGWAAKNIPTFLAFGETIKANATWLGGIFLTAVSAVGRMMPNLAAGVNLAAAAFARMWLALTGPVGIVAAIGAALVVMASFIGRSETVKNSIQEWALSSDNLTAKLYRLVTAQEKLRAAQAHEAITANAQATRDAADAAAEAAAKTKLAADQFLALKLQIQGFTPEQIKAKIALQDVAAAANVSGAAYAEAADKAKTAAADARKAADDFQQMKDRLSGADTARDLVRVVEVLRQLTNEGQRTPEAMRGVATELRRIQAAGGDIHEWGRRIVDTFGGLRGAAEETAQPTAEITAKIDKLRAVVASMGLLDFDSFKRLAVDLKALQAEGANLSGFEKDVVQMFGAVAEKAAGAGKATTTMAQQLADAQKEMGKFSAAQRDDIKAGDAMHHSVEDITKSLNLTTPSLHASSEAVQLFVDKLHAGSQASRQAAKDFAEITGATAKKDATDLVKQIGAGQIQLAKLSEESQRKVGQILIEGSLAWHAAGESVSDSVKAQIDAVGKLRIIPDLMKQATAFGVDEQARISKESAQKVADAQKVINDRILENIKAATAAYKASYALRDQLEGASLQRTLARIAEEFRERRDALNKNNAFYKDAIDAIGEEERLTAEKATREWMFGQAETRDQLQRTADHAREQFENIGRSNQFTAEEVQAAWERWYEADQRARGAWAGGWMSALDGIVDAFQKLAQIGDGALSTIVRDVGVFLASLKLGRTAAEGLNKGIKEIGDGQTMAGLADAATGLLGIASAFLQATEHGNTFAKTLKGAALGAKIGNQFGPIGTAIGAAVGGTAGFLRGIFGVSDVEKEGRQAAKDFRAGIKAGLNAAQQEELRANIKIGADPSQTAVVIAIRDAYQALGRNASEADDVVRRLWDAEKQGGKAVQKVIDEVNDAFREQAKLAADAKEFADTLPGVLDAIAKSGDLVSAKFQGIIDKMKATGQFTKELREFVVGQAAVGAGGVTGFLKVGADAIDALKAKEQELGDLRKQLSDANEGSQDDIREKIAKVTREIEIQQTVLKVAGISSQQSAEALGASLFGVFAEMQRQGKSVTEALATVMPGVLAMQKQLERTGFSGGAAFNELRRLAAVMTDEIGGPAVTAILSLRDAFVGLHNAGLLDQKTFAGLAKQVADTFDALVKQGKDGEAALKLIQPTLQTIWELQQDFGFAVDDATQKLLDQGVAAGLVGAKHRSINDQIAKGIDRLVVLMEAFVKSLGIDVPTAADEARKAVGRFNDQLLGSVDAAGNIVDALSGIPTDLTVRVNFDVGDVPSFDRSGGGGGDGGGNRGSGEPVSRGYGSGAEADAAAAAIGRGYSQGEVDRFLGNNPGDYGRLVDVFRHQGGMVWKRAHQGWMIGSNAMQQASRSLAHDEVPIIAQAGEGVLSRRGMQAVGGPTALASLNSGGQTAAGSTINLTAHVSIDGTNRDAEQIARELAPALVTEFRRNYGGVRSEMESMFEKKKAS